MHKYKSSSSPGQTHCDRQPDASRPTSAKPAFTPNCDIFGIRAIFEALEKDLTALLERKFRRLRALDALLGSQALFDDKTGKAAKIQRRRDALKHELDTLFANRDYLDYMTNFALESWGKLNAAYNAERQQLEQTNAALRAAYLNALDEQAAIIAMWNNDLKRQNASRL